MVRFFFESESSYLDCNKVIEDIESIQIKKQKKINLNFYVLKKNLLI